MSRECIIIWPSEIRYRIGHPRGPAFMKSKFNFVMQYFMSLKSLTCCCLDGILTDNEITGSRIAEAQRRCRPRKEGSVFPMTSENF